MINTLQAAPQEERLNIQRTFEAPLDLVWELWTTRQGIESWWGPEGFEVAVNAIDVRPEGRLDYVMTAVDPDMRAYMEREGMPASTDVSLVYKEVTPETRLRYIDLVNFVPGVEPYEVATEVELESNGKDVTVSLTFDRMHDDMWSERKLAGWKSELGKLEKVALSLKRGDA